jgi:hypothetical protein
MPTPPPVFILASPHSEVSLISAMLGQHPRAYAVPELNLFTVGTLVEMFDFLPSGRTRGLIRALAQLYCGEQTIETAETARRWIFRRLKRPTGEVHQELCRKIGPLRLIDPSGLHSEVRRRDALERILYTYPDAHFLHLVRHPRTQGEAWLRNPVGLGQLFALGSVDVGPRQRSPDPQIDWYRRNAALLEFLSDMPRDRRLRMRVEDILADPRQYLRELTDWLGLDWSEDILEAMLHPERSSYCRPGPFGAEGGGDTSFLASPHYRNQTREPEDLAGALPWRPDGKGFRPELVALAHSFGYT